MNTNTMCVMLLALTALIFGANHYAARNGLQGEECVKCNCLVKLKYPDVPPAEEPSCSVIFTFPAPYKGNFTETFALSRLKQKGSFNECDTAVVCDKNSEAELTCNNRFGREKVEYKTSIFPQTRCSIKCERVEGDLLPSLFGNPAVHGDKVTKTTCEHWERKPAQKPPTKKKDSRQPKGPSADLSESIFASFIPATYIPEPDDEEPGEVVTDQAWWRTYQGDAGTDEGVLTVISGQADIRSFCTGDEAQLAGPGTMSLPFCRADSLGRWQGTYGRRIPKASPTPLGINLDLRKEGRYIGGEIATPEGTYKITTFSQSGASTEIKGSGTFSGKQRDIVMYCRTGKGELVFEGYEGTPGEVSVKIVGIVSRVFIADNALPPAILDQPYTFGLIAFSPFSDVLLFSLAEGRLPRGISFDGRTGTFTGSPTETGKFNIRITVTDSAGNSFGQAFTLEVKKLGLLARWLPDAVVGQPYTAQLVVVGGRPPYTFSGGAPPGMTLDPNTGILSGTPTRLDNAIRAVFITDGQKTYEGDRLSLRVRGFAIMDTHYLPPARKGVPYRTKLTAMGQAPTKWYISPVNPDFSMDDSGELSGTPKKSGTYVLGITARSTNDQQSRKFAIEVAR